MTNMQTVMAIFAATLFPTATALVVAMLNRKDSQELRTYIQAEFSGVRENITQVRERISHLEGAVGGR